MSSVPFAFPRDDRNLPRFWLPGFYDFNVHRAKKRREKLDSVRANPLKGELVEHPKDWPSSSCAFDARGKARLVPIDPVGG